MASSSFNRTHPGQSGKLRMNLALRTITPCRTRPTNLKGQLVNGQSQSNHKSVLPPERTVVLSTLHATHVQPVGDRTIQDAETMFQQQKLNSSVLHKQRTPRCNAMGKTLLKTEAWPLAVQVKQLGYEPRRRPLNMDEAPSWQNSSSSRPANTGQRNAKTKPRSRRR